MKKLIFLHILKCGGTSLRYSLLEEFGYDRIAPVPIGADSREWDYPCLRGVDPLQYQLEITPDAVTDYDVVMSHYDWRITERLPDRQVITVLRHPVSQLYSLYRYMRRNVDLKRLHPEAQKMTFRAWLVSDLARPLLNTQTRYMSGHGCESRAAALANLRSDRLTFGLVERFSESVQLFNRRFGWSLRCRHDNQAPEDESLGRSEVRLAKRLQRDDMALYRTACDLFEERLALPLV